MASVEPVTNYRLIGPSEVGRVEDLLAGKPEKESRQRLQALIAEWLRMENLVVLTGAGCSVSLGGKTMDALEGDWGAAWALFSGNIAYVWHGALHSTTVAESLVGQGFSIRAQIIWAKERLVMSRGDYHWMHEPCWYAVRTKGHWTGDRKQTTLWNIASGGQDSETAHSTQKPVECMRRPMQNNSNPGQAIYDPFLGSGTTLIAAETTGRVCLGMELEPRYVDVAVRRWQAFTGLTACLHGDGRPYDVIAAERLTGLQETNSSPAAAQRVDTAVMNEPAAD